MDRKNWWSAVAISVLYAFDYEGADLFLRFIPLIKHSINFSFLFLVAIIGSYAFNSFNENWPKKLWDCTYITVISILIIYGLTDLVYPVTSVNIREMFSNFRMFFTTPVPFGILILLLNYRFKNKQRISKDGVKKA